MNRLPLIDRPLDAPLALHLGETITAGRFLAQAIALSERLPPGQYGFNLCLNRYAFSLAFAALAIAGKTSMSPPNRLKSTVEELSGRYPDSFVLTDAGAGLDNLEHMDPSEFTRLEATTTSIPVIAADHLAAIVFTSGSTGQCCAVAKPWRTLVESTRINARGMGLDTQTVSLLTTVPPQHMWGLETSVLMPWFAPVTVATAQPFFFHNIADHLASLPVPRVLVSTPVHLRAIALSDHSLPPLTRLFSATAPLEPELARNLETKTGADLIEIYGCTESGSLARRRTAADEPWALLDGFHLERTNRQVMAYADHLPEPVKLMDEMEILADGRFRLTGRTGDLINVAGKRASLTSLNQRLLEISGVVDGVIFQPPADSRTPVARLAALVVAPGLSVDYIRRELGRHLDPVFIPRPIRLVEALPRAETGKLPRRALLAAYELELGVQN